MSTPRRIDPKAASKRRAERRRRTRETLGRIGIIVIVAILVLSTVSTVILPTTVTAPSATVVGVVPTATQSNLAVLQSLVTDADQAAAAGNWEGAAELYNAYLAQDATNGEVHFKLGKAYLSMVPPKYVDALAELQRAININPSAAYVEEAQALIALNSDNVPTSGPITGTVTTLPGTITGTVTTTTTLTGTTAVTGTIPATMSPSGTTPTP